MVPINTIFDIKYGNQFDFSKMFVSKGPDSINFIGRGSTDNGFVDTVELIEGIEPFEPGLITVTMGGSYLLASFVQPKPFYTGQNVKVLTPKIPMSLGEKLFYCASVQHNRFRYHSHSREANSTFDDLLVPSRDEVPDYCKNLIIDEVNTSSIDNIFIGLYTSNWEQFRFDDIFIIKKGFYNKKPELNLSGNIPFIGATSSNNGITGMCDLDTIERTSKTGDDKNAPLSEKLFDGNCITVSNNGSVGFAFYQAKPFTCSHDVNPLYLKDKNLNPFIALFLCAVIEHERYRWAYGRKWRPVRMPSSKISLPVDANKNPDWEYMENFIKSLSYSSNLV